MRRYLLYYGLLCWLLSCWSCKTSQPTPTTTPQSLSKQELQQGVKEVLLNGLSTSITKISEGQLLNTPTMRLSFPKNWSVVEQKLKDIGLGSKVQEFVHEINQTTMTAARATQPIFSKAIQELPIAEAQQIIKGGDDAATVYLRQRTEPQLQQALQPLLKRNIENSKAGQLLILLIETYNKLPMVDKVNPDISGYVTKVLLDTVFFAIAQQEYALRHNPAVRTTVLLQRIFTE